MSARAFTLLETILSIAILGLVLILVFNLYPTSILGLRRAENQMEADALARSLLDEYRARPFSELTPAPPTSLPPRSGGDRVEFRPTVEVRTVAGAVEGRLVEVRVTVDWDLHGAHRVLQSLYVSSLRR